MRKIRTIATIIALVLAPLVTHYGDQGTENEGFTVVGVGGYEVRGPVGPGWFVCDGQC